ncbi:MAG: precorrin-6y C5,15-methyltransferase (decarboxylating) subunit CbiE [Acidimicrobiales bacterium]
MGEEAVPISIVGLHGGESFGEGARMALRRADLLLGHRRQLDLLPADLPGDKVELWGQLDTLVELAAKRSDEGCSVCILASGDPGFFGLVRMAADRLGASRLEIHPAPSAVSLAFARLGLNWDDAVVVSAHGRPMTAAVDAVLRHPKVAVMVSADQPPQALGEELRHAGSAPRQAAVCSRLGEPDESIWRGDLEGLAGGSWDPMSVVVLLAPRAAGEGAIAPTLAWGLPDQEFDHREGMITKAEVRAVALGKLALPPAGVLWDVGAGAGSVAVECARLAPGLSVYAIERRADDLQRLEANARGTAITPVLGEAPRALAALPDPDRVFVGGGGLEVLDAVLERLRPGGVVVAAYAAMSRAEAAGRRLGQLVQITVNHAAPIGRDATLRLQAANPVFVAWGPEHHRS